MSEDKKIAFRITAKQLVEVEKLKQKSYYNKTYADLYRDLIAKGLEVSKQTKKGE